MQLKTSLLLTALLTGLATATTLPTDDGPTPLLSLPDDTSVADLPEQTTAPTLIPSDDGDDTSEPSDTTDVPTTLVPSPTTNDDDTLTPTDTITITSSDSDSDSGTATTSPAETHTHDATATTTDNGTMTSSSDAADETGSGEDDDDSGRGDEDRQRTTTRAASTPTSINAAAGKSQFGLAVLGVALVAGLGL
jgi:hypothetical protein